MVTQRTQIKWARPKLLSGKSDERRMFLQAKQKNWSKSVFTCEMTRMLTAVPLCQQGRPGLQLGAEGDGGKGKYIKKIQQNSGEAGRAKDHTNSDFLRWKHFFYAVC